MTKEIRFYRVREPYGAFSNFSPDMFMLDGVAWPTVEHYYQAMKHDDPSFRDEIRACRSPKEAKNLAYTRPARVGWDDERISVMKTALRAKFTQHEGLKGLLLSTGDATLIEASPWDSFWGCGSDGSGRNMLGVALMDLRADLREADGHVGVMRGVIAGGIDQEEAVRRSMGMVIDADSAIPSSIGDAYVNHIMNDDGIRKGLDSMASIIDAGGYDKCHRGAFLSYAFRVVEESVQPLWSPFRNAPPVDALRVCMFDGGCIRDMSRPRSVVGSGYDNCPSIHALERMLYSSGTGVMGNDVVWVEMGVLRGDLGAWHPWMIGEGEVYPCLQCLRAASNAGIRHLIAVDSSSPSTFRLCDVSAHMSHIMIRETIGALRRTG